MLEKFDALKKLASWEIRAFKNNGEIAERREQYNYIYCDGTRYYATNGAVAISVPVHCGQNVPIGHYEISGKKKEKEIRHLNFNRAFVFEGSHLVTRDKWLEDDNSVWFEDFPENTRFKLEFCCFCKDFVGEDAEIYLNSKEGVLLFRGKRGEMAAIRYYYIEEP